MWALEGVCMPQGDTDPLTPGSSTCLWGRKPRLLGSRQSGRGCLQGEGVGRETAARPMGPWGLWEVAGQRCAGGAPAPQEAEPQRVTHIPRGPGSRSICPVPASQSMSAPDKQACTPLLQGHQPFQIWTRTGERSYKPLLSLPSGLCQISV